MTAANYFNSFMMPGEIEAKAKKYENVSKKCITCDKVWETLRKSMSNKCS